MISPWEAGANMLCALELSDDDPQWVKNFVERVCPVDGKYHKPRAVAEG